MNYYIPEQNSSFAAAVIDNLHVDGSRGNGLAVWSGPNEGKARTRIRSALMRERVNLVELAAPNGGTVFVMPLRYANEPFWRNYIENTARNGLTVEHFESDKLDRAVKKLEMVSGFNMKAPEVVGRNRYGYTVYDRTFGRTAHKIGDHRDVVPEWSRKNGEYYGRKHPEMFFRAHNDFDLAENARSIFIQMANNEALSNAEIKRLATALSTTDFIVRPRELMEHVEAEISRCIALGEVKGREGLDALMATFPRQRERTAATIINQQYSTPYPFGLAASQIFGDVAGKSVLEPTIGNGALIAPFAASGADVSGYEIDYGRFIRATRAVGDMAEVIENSDFLSAAKNIPPESFDLVVANPPFDGLPTHVDIPIASSKFTTDRLHFAIAVESIRRLKVGGSAFFVLPANILNPEEKGSSANRFHNLLKLVFNEVEEAVANGRLYQGMGTNIPVQLYAAHGFREKLHPFNVLNDPKFMGKPRTLNTFADLYDWADDCRARFGYSQLAVEGQRPIQEPEQHTLPEPETASPSSEPAEQSAVSAPVPRPVLEEPGSQAQPEPERGQGEGEHNSEPRSASGGPSSSTPVKPAPPLEATTNAKSPSDTSPATTPPRTADPEPVLKDDPLPQWLADTLSNEEGQPYRPLSLSGSASSIIPKSLSGAIYGALDVLDADLKRRNGKTYDIDNYVADALRITKDDLLKGERLSPEQVDGVALCLSGMSDGRGVLMGDLMGLGKGRELSAILECALADGDPVMFVTVNPSLFSDFLVRDLTDVSQIPTQDRIDSGEINLHLVNADGLLVGSDDNVIYRQKGRQKSYDFPPDANVVASTYSQFQKADTGRLRLDAVVAWMSQHISDGRRPRLLLDEAHKAASPDSNTGVYFSQLCRFVEDNGGSVIWSSATGIKSGQHVELYYSALPDTGLGKSELLDIMSGSDALSLQEALSHEMASSGALFVRKLADQGIGRDLPRLVDYDPDKVRKIRAKVDETTDILRDIIEFMPDIIALAKAKANTILGGSISRSSGDKLKLDTNSPVSNLHHFSGYLTLAMKGHFLDELVTDSLARGEKQVFTIEHLSKTLLDWKITQSGELLKDSSGAEYFLSPPNLGDVLKRYVENAVNIKATDAIGNTATIDLSEELGPWMAGMNAQIADANLDDMRIDGADLIKASLDKMGLSCGELTGRTRAGGVGVTGDIDGRFYLYDIEKGGAKASKQIANAFNNGELDALVLNKSSSAGISLQAAKSVGDDLRRRCMIKMELLSDIVDERQIEGRVNRKGQEEGPRYVAPLTGFVSDDRLASLYNRKNRSLSASTNATRENSTNIDEVVDLLNPIGRGVVYSYLKSNPDLAQSLNIKVNDVMESDDSQTRKLLGRLIVRPLEEQNRIIGEIDVIYRLRSEYLDRRGLNPNKNNRHDWRGKIVDKEVLLSGNRVSGLASQPVYLTTIEAQTTVAPISYEQVKKKLKRGLANAESRGDLPELMSKAFEDTGKPVFQSRPWLKAVGQIDRSYFDSDASRDISKMAEELQQFNKIYGHNYARASKLKSDADKAKLETIFNAKMLYNLSETISVGRAIFLNTELLTDIAETRIASVVRSPDNSSETWVPAIVTSYSASSAYPLNTDYHNFEVAIPGEAEPVRINVGNVARHLQSQEQFEVTWPKVKIAISCDEYLLRYQKNAPHGVDAIQAWLAPHPDNDGMFTRATPENSAIASALPQSVTNRPEQNELFHGMFDRTVAGVMMDQKRVLTGNMFRSLNLTRQKNKQSAGTKILFSDSKGVWHHGIEVGGGQQDEKLQKLRDKAQVSANSSPSIKTPLQLDRLFRLVMEQDGTQPFYNWPQNIPSPFQHINDIYGVVGPTRLEDKIRVDGLPPFIEGLNAMPCAFVGPDVITDKLLETNGSRYRGLNKFASVLLRPYTLNDKDRDLVGGYDAQHDHIRSAISSCYKELKRGEMYYFPLKGSATVIFNPKNKVLQADFPELLERASDYEALEIDGSYYKAPSGMVGISIPWAYDDAGELAESSKKIHNQISEALMQLSDAKKQPVLFTGAIRMMVERLDAVAFGLERDAALYQNNSIHVKDNERRPVAKHKTSLNA